MKFETGITIPNTTIVCTYENDAINTMWLDKTHYL